MAFDPTVGGVNATSYVGLIYANSLFENVLKPNVWDSATPDEQERALMTATMWLEEFDYVGSPATTTQALKWPRFGWKVDSWGNLDPNGTIDLVLGKYDETEMPIPLLNAACELAYYLLTLGEAGAAALTTGLGAVSSLRIGNSVQVQYAQQSASTAPLTDPSGLPMHVARLLRGLRLPVVIA